jgi:hypothetical protein|tara:strand:+ start:914 stop:1117 length:204 start_codon:yes stop_codon:yes gene_type:complete
MKIINYFFRPQYMIGELQKENKRLKLRMQELVDENHSLWDMLEEIKEADKQANDYRKLINTEAIGEA